MSKGRMFGGSFRSPNRRVCSKETEWLLWSWQIAEHIHAEGSVLFPVLTAYPHRMYDHDVRRTLAIALLALFSFSLIGPVAFASDPESNLPACCRRAGKHYCAMLMAEAGSSSGPSIQASRCPSFPQGSGATALPHTGLLKTSQVASSSIVSWPVDRPASDTLYRVAFCSTCQKRGPPAFFLS